MTINTRSARPSWATSNSKSTGHHFAFFTQAGGMEKEQETLTHTPTASETYQAIDVPAPQEQKLKEKVHTNKFWSTQETKYIKCCKALAFELL